MFIGDYALVFDEGKGIQDLINFEEFEYRQTKGDLESLNDAQECLSPANV